MDNRDLEKKMVRYRDLITVKSTDNREPFFAVDKENLFYGYLRGMDDMQDYFSGKIIVRGTVYEKLKKADRNLRIAYPDYRLYITYGYRSLEIQTQRFLKQLSITSRGRFFSNPFDLYEEAHRFIAVPTVSGHPTGGAVDVTIVNRSSNTFIDFGSDIYDFESKKCYVETAGIPDKARRNRLLLRKLMLDQGFAPFDG
jgi:D-alanyl-D-alanine dipeptidase